MNAGSVFSFWLGLRRLGRSDSIDLVVPMALSFLWPRLSAELAVAFVSSFSRSGLPFGLVVSCRSRRSVVFVVLLVSSPGRVRRSVGLVVPTDLFFPSTLSFPFVSSSCRSRRSVGLVVPSVSSSRCPCRSYDLFFPPASSFLSYRHPVGFVVLTVSSIRRFRRPVGVVVPLSLSFLLTFSFRTRRSFRIVPSVSSFCRSRRSVGTGRVCAYSQHNLVSSSLHGLTAEAEHAQGMMHFPKASNVNCAGEVFC